jgi:hypothetical protein
MSAQGLGSSTQSSTTRVLSTLFSSCYYDCGFEEEVVVEKMENMKRASVSRRQQPGDADTFMRSRSSENLDCFRENELVVTTATPDDRQDYAEQTPILTVHRRAHSDPFDTQEQDSGSIKADSGDEFQKDCTNNNNSRPKSDFAPTTNVGAIPTMPRFPVSDTRNKNCFSEPPVSIFSVRGPHYFLDKKKCESANYLLEARGCDLFLTDNTSKSALQLSTK